MDGWAGVRCCPDTYPILSGGACAAPNGTRHRIFPAERTRRRHLAPTTTAAEAAFPRGCASGTVTGLPRDLARCVIVALDLSGHGLTKHPDLRLEPSASRREPNRPLHASGPRADAARCRATCWTACRI